MQESQPQLPNRPIRYAVLPYYLLCHLRGLMTALGDFVRKPIASFVTLIVLAIAISLPAGLFFLLKNVEYIAQSWHGVPSISLFLDNNTSPEQLQQLQSTLSGLPGVQHIEYISPEKGLNELASNDNLKNTLNQLPNNPLPGVIVITPKLIDSTAEKIPDLLEQIKKLPGVSHAEFDTSWVKRLYYVVAIGERLTYTIALLFGLGLILIIGNTIRLSTESHREEINILKLIGAKNSFIRRPLLYRGLLYGFIGSLLSCCMINGVIYWIEKPTSELAATYQSLFQLQYMNAFSIFVLLLIGSLLGLLGAYLAVNRYLKLPEEL